MSKNRVSLSELENEISSLEIDSLKEEQNNANLNYKYLDLELKKVTDAMPYPDVREYDTASDYESIGILQCQKRMNKPYWEKVQQIEPYCQNGSLYKGHVQIHDSHFYMMESKFLKTKELGNDSKNWLINIDDRNYSKVLHDWRYPEKNNSVNLSRNIVLGARKVKNVDVILDRSTDLYSNITDRYLRNALIRNKNNTFCQSIIQTIQEKQNKIRELPEDSSFIVQGCAGSGKTMVLLHRLRYLLYNDEIHNGQFMFIVPSLDFKDFIGKMLSDFNIKKQNVMICKEYYQSVCGKAEDTVEDVSELVFSQEYLNKIYSKKFLQQSYQELFNEVNDSLNLLISVCEEQLNKQIELETSQIEQNIDKIQRQLLSKVQMIANSVEPYIHTKLSLNLEDIEQFILELKTNWANKKEEYDKITGPSFEVFVDDNDDRILSDSRIKSLMKQIESEKEIIQKASIFTVLSHKRKLKNIEDRFNELKKSIIDDIKIIEEENMKKRAMQLQYVYDGITMENVENMLNTLVPLLEENKVAYSKLKNIMQNIEEYLGDKYSSQISNLNDLIDLSSASEMSFPDYVDRLYPAIQLFEKIIVKGRELLDCFKSSMQSEEEKEVFGENLKLFNNKTSKQIQALLNGKLFSICRKKIFEEFGIKINKLYKHYWYLNAYCTYLTKELNTKSFSHIFVDEAQDLNVNEIDLITKLNLIKENNRIKSSVMNLFGDINQTITEFGITDWHSITEIPKVYYLEENFRNTNQIVKYCNSHLSMNMTDVGVDMEDVEEFDNLDIAFKESKNKFEDAVFIVKDEYMKQDLKRLLNMMNVRSYVIYTVKDSKGLEFKETYVITKGMSKNEKYIAFTRALAQLKVIFEIPELVKEHEDLIVQGDEIDEIFNEYIQKSDQTQMKEKENTTMEVDVSGDSNLLKNQIDLDKNFSNKLSFPGKEPVHIRVYLDKLFMKLNGYYPLREIDDLEKIDTKLLENISYISEVLGYANEYDFLKAYRYKFLKD